MRSTALRLKSCVRLCPKHVSDISAACAVCAHSRWVERLWECWCEKNTYQFQKDTSSLCSPDSVSHPESDLVWTLQAPPRSWDPCAVCADSRWGASLVMLEENLATYQFQKDAFSRCWLGSVYHPESDLVWILQAPPRHWGPCEGCRGSHRWRRSSGCCSLWSWNL